MENFKKPKTSMKNWAEDDRPREKMMKSGSDVLSNSELIAIIINNGSREDSALSLSKDILELAHNNLDELGKMSLKDMQKVKGIGPAKAIAIAAALELGRRRSATVPLQRISARSSREIFEFLQNSLKDYKYEVFAVLFLNRANKIKSFKIMSRGGMTGTVADPRLILKQALEEEATAIILSHNHPSGNIAPSRMDKEITYKIKEAAAYLDIVVADHIIVSNEGYYSFADEGLL